MDTTDTWEDDPNGTRMTLRNRGESAGFARVAGDGGRRRSSESFRCLVRIAGWAQPFFPRPSVDHRE
jgi:hypothetical protein